MVGEAPMYKDEVIRRLEQGQSPVLISADKWWQLYQYAMDKSCQFEDCGRRLGGNTCALCIVYADDGCKECPLSAVDWCGDENSLWKQAVRAAKDREAFAKAALRMFLVLQGLEGESHEK